MRAFMGLAIVVALALPGPVAWAQSAGPSRERAGDAGQEDERSFRSVFMVPAVALAIASVGSLGLSAAITAVVQADNSLTAASIAEAQRQEFLRRTPIDLHLFALVLVVVALVSGVLSIGFTVLNFVWPLQLKDINQFFNRR